MAQLKASTGLRSTRETARQREVSEVGTSNVSEPESLRKTHLTREGARITDSQLQYTVPVKLAPKPRGEIFHEGGNLRKLVESPVRLSALIRPIGRASGRCKKYGGTEGESVSPR